MVHERYCRKYFALAARVKQKWQWNGFFKTAVLAIERKRHFTQESLPLFPLFSATQKWPFQQLKRDKNIGKVWKEDGKNRICLLKETQWRCTFRRKDYFFMLSRSRTVGQQYTDPTKRRYSFFQKKFSELSATKMRPTFLLRKKGGEGTARIWPTERATGAFFPEKKGVEGEGRRGGKGRGGSGIFRDFSPSSFFALALGQFSEPLSSCRRCPQDGTGRQE